MVVVKAVCVCGGASDDIKLVRKVMHTSVLLGF